MVDLPVVKGEKSSLDNFFAVDAIVRKKDTALPGQSSSSHKAKSDHHQKRKPQPDASGYFTNWMLMEELKTGENAVDYFLKRTTHNYPVKFLYLVQRDPGYSGYFPYDLVVVEQCCGGG